MAAVGIGMVLFFRAKGWLGERTDWDDEDDD
jgi:hypothetical protein